MPLFRERLAGFEITFITDEQIIAANPKHNLEQIRAMPGHLGQQVVKSEFWRLGLSENFVCLDSDNEFIRPFYKADFLAPDGHPYTVITEGKEFLDFSARYHMPKVPANFKKDSLQVQELFGREGKIYSFGIPPLVWSKQVWHALEEGMLIPRNQSLACLLYTSLIPHLLNSENSLRREQWKPFLDTIQHEWRCICSIKVYKASGSVSVPRQSEATQVIWGFESYTPERPPFK